MDLLKHIPDRRWLRKRWPHLLFAVLTAVVFHQALFHLSTYGFGDSLDAVKNYYTLGWFTDHDSGFAFTGMHYPFEGSNFYTDGHPPLGMLCSFLGISSSGAIALLNVWLIASFVLALSLFHKWFMRWGIPQWASAGLAICIVLLSPQIGRLGAHYALSYIFVFPLGFLIVESKRLIWKKALFFLVLGTLVMFTHPYLGVLCIGSTGLYCAGSTLMERCRKEALLNLLAISLAGLGSLLLFELFSTLTDPWSGLRPSPYQSGADYSYLESFIFPGQGSYIPMEGYDVDGVDWEGRSYLGLAGMICAVLAIPLLLIRKQARRFGLPLLLVAFLGVFMSTGLGDLDLLRSFSQVPGLREFRALGRFSWLGYYGIALFAFTAVAMFLRKKPVALGTMVVLALVSTAIEANLQWEWIGHFTGRNVLYPTENLPVQRSENKPVVAITTHPFAFVGSDVYGTERNEDLLKYAMQLSLQEGLPMVNCVASRVPSTVARAIVGHGGAYQMDSLMKAGGIPPKAQLLVLTKQEWAGDAKQLQNAKRVWQNKHGYVAFLMSVQEYIARNREQRNPPPQAAISAAMDPGIMYTKLADLTAAGSGPLDITIDYILEEDRAVSASFFLQTNRTIGEDKTVNWLNTHPVGHITGAFERSVYMTIQADVPALDSLTRLELFLIQDTLRPSQIHIYKDLIEAAPRRD